MKKKDYKNFLNGLVDRYAEVNSELADCIEAFLKGDSDYFSYLGKDGQPTRFIQARIPKTKIIVEYDTLTTELMYEDDAGYWRSCTDHEYSKN